ncbi:hypothetical protein F5141DRAFT_1061971 [Pisolithus sp. B1]|nr:hypothetical protein F5141DRAFT_1061971 [Pisolithus sp. B1]
MRRSRPQLRVSGASEEINGPQKTKQGSAEEEESSRASTYRDFQGGQEEARTSTMKQDGIYSGEFEDFQSPAGFFRVQVEGCQRSGRVHALKAVEDRKKAANEGIVTAIRSALPAAPGYWLLILLDGQNHRSIAAATLGADIPTYTPEAMPTSNIAIGRTTMAGLHARGSVTRSSHGVLTIIYYTVPGSCANHGCTGWAAFGARGVFLTFYSGNYGVQVRNPAVIQQRRSEHNDIHPGFPSILPLMRLPRDCRKTISGCLVVTRAKHIRGFGITCEDQSYASVLEARISSFLRQRWASCQCQFGCVEGASASSPTFASIISMVNNTRIGEGKKGFLNPWLYPWASPGWGPGEAYEEFHSPNWGSRFGTVTGDLMSWRALIAMAGTSLWFLLELHCDIHTYYEGLINRSKV